MVLGAVSLVLTISSRYAFAADLLERTSLGGYGELHLNWSSLIQPHQTVVIYMGLTSLATIARGFVEHGADPATPAAVIENGTRKEQRVITGTLHTLPDKTAAADIRSPALIIVGSVVTLQDKLSWFSAAGVPADQY